MSSSVQILSVVLVNDEFSQITVKGTPENVRALLVEMSKRGQLETGWPKGVRGDTIDRILETPSDGKWIFYFKS